MTDRLFRAKLHVVPTEEGGRKTPFTSGYRPQFHIAASEYCTSFMIQKIVGAEQMAPGESGDVEAFLLHPEGLGVPVVAGMKFELREGWKIVGRGAIEEFL